MGEAFEGKLPEKFEERMRALLREEYGAFAESYKRERTLGLRLNILKVDPEVFFREFGDDFGLRPVPWCREGFYYDKEARPGRHPFHEAGVYYIQEPSAMAAVALLDPRPGERVLDLCGAPGGKSTHAGGRMMGQGLLISNEIHPARVKILSRNIERMGIKNAVVTNEEPARLADYFPEFFDKIVVDAPCSGEGMFRKDESARKEWSPENVRLCAKRQTEILESAAKMLRPGGRLLYSTCTFSPEEDEVQIEGFLERHGEFFVVKVPENVRPAELSPGRGEWGTKRSPALSDTFRIWPHLSEGEGHFMALLEKEAPKDSLKTSKEKPKKKQANQRQDKEVKKAQKLFAEFIEEAADAKELPGLGRLLLFGDQLYCIPREMPDFDGLRVIRPGLHLGTVKKGRFEPSHALALALKGCQVKKAIRLEPEGRELFDYLSGKALEADDDGRGWVVVCAGDYPAGWGKLAGGLVKNHYPKGLRLPL